MMAMTFAVQRQQTESSDVDRQTLVGEAADFLFDTAAAAAAQCRVQASACVEACRGRASAASSHAQP